MIDKDLEEMERHEEEICNHIHRQILGLSDQIRSKQAWLKILEGAHPEAIANALSAKLTHFNYQEVPRCKCPRRCGNSCA